ncbi:hypothetical protein [Rhizobium leguminosarum]|uniref:hypothetical protein n=1 Tax=Rhizobium leguminosarum TaxID=384 RepID=UPI003F96ED07
MPEPPLQEAKVEPPGEQPKSADKASELQEPAPKERALSNVAQIVSATAASLSLVIALAAAGLAYRTFSQTYAQNVDRDRKAAAVRMCEAYATSPRVTSAVDAVYKGLRKDNKLYSPDPAIFPDETGDLRLNLKTFIQFLEAAGSGLTADVYDVGVIDRCLGDSFIQAGQYLLGPAGSRNHMVRAEDFPEVGVWAIEFTYRRCVVDVLGRNGKASDCRRPKRIGTTPVLLLHAK